MNFGLLNWTRRLLCDSDYLWTMGCFLIVVDLFICGIVVSKVSYTEIDWTAYMEQASLFLNGTWNYTNLVGGTGPLVYPAGHLYIYSGLYLITDKGTNIKLGQWLFCALYLLTLPVVFRIYQTSKKVPPYVLLFLCCCSYRVHSIYMLRMFNDPLAMFLLYCAVLLWLNNKWTLGCIVYSLAVSVKMNILLFAPALGAVLLVKEGKFRTFIHIVTCALVQVLLAVPFLAVNPKGYIGRAFNFGRIFLYEWTVNWRFLSEEIFVDLRFHILLLIAHLLVLVFFASTLWFRNRGGLWKLVKEEKRVAPEYYENVNEILFTLFSANFTGIVFSRSLHYQFYCWYFHSLPYLLWSTSYHPVINMIVLMGIEAIWNVFPSRWWSSLSLHGLHFVILIGLVNEKLKTKHKLGQKKEK